MDLQPLYSAKEQYALSRVDEYFVQNDVRFGSEEERLKKRKKLAPHAVEYQEYLDVTNRIKFLCSDTFWKYPVLWSFNRVNKKNPFIHERVLFTTDPDYKLDETKEVGRVDEVFFYDRADLDAREAEIKTLIDEASKLDFVTRYGVAYMTSTEKQLRRENGTYKGYLQERFKRALEHDVYYQYAM